jgi:hypothetical protein
MTDKLRIESTLADARADVQFKERELISLALSISRQMKDLAATVQGGGVLNSLGELQGRGPALDVKVADLCAAREALARLERMAQAAQEEPSA